MSGVDTPIAPPAEYPLGDILYVYLSSRFDELLMELREYLNEQGLTVTRVTDEHVDGLVEEINTYLQEKNTNESE